MIGVIRIKKGKVMSEILQLLKEDGEERMQKSVENTKDAFTKIRTGRAHTSLLDHIHIDYYGSHVPLKQVANINVLDPRTLGVTPWEKNMVQAVEKAIMNADLGLNPVTVGTLLRIPLPAMTEERRKELIKVVRHEAEGGRVAIRNVRRDINAQLKTMVKNKEISEDDERRAEEQTQKLTDKYIAEIDKILAAKEEELMEV
jgi:ribosome recycling factor